MSDKRQHILLLHIPLVVKHEGSKFQIQIHLEEGRRGPVEEEIFFQGPCHVKSKPHQPHLHPFCHTQKTTPPTSFLIHSHNGGLGQERQRKCQRSAKRYWRNTNVYCITVGGKIPHQQVADYQQQLSPRSVLRPVNSKHEPRSLRQTKHTARVCVCMLIPVLYWTLGQAHLWAQSVVFSILDTSQSSRANRGQ